MRRYNGIHYARRLTQASFVIILFAMPVFYILRYDVAAMELYLFGKVCPLAFRIRFDRKNFAKCTDCKACEKTCFMNVKPRLPFRDINCINCGECIVACREELGRDDGLFSYSLGSYEGEIQHKIRDRSPAAAAEITCKES